jgi:hypothetical protein
MDAAREERSSREGFEEWLAEVGGCTSCEFS